MDESLSVSIVGAGAVGTALAHALTSAGIPVPAIASRSEAHAQELAASLPGSRAVSVRDAGNLAKVVVLTVSDSAIGAAAADIDVPPDLLVAHASGSRDVGVLETARAHGARVGSLHPLAAFSRDRRSFAAAPEVHAAKFRGAAFAIEGDDSVRQTLTHLAVKLGGQPFAIRAEDKPLYHLGASMLAAFSAGLAEFAWTQMQAAGAGPRLGSTGVAHLLHTVADNIAMSPSPAAAQTGPVARGDAGGLERQASTARRLPLAVQAIYRAHVTHTIEMAEQAGRIDAATARALFSALEDTTRPASAAAPYRPS